MDSTWKAWGGGFLLFCAAWAPGQVPALPAPAAAGPSAPMLTLSSPLVRSTMGRMNLSWMFPETIPDFRLKVERPVLEGPLSPAEMETRLRGVEIRLPMEGLWMGYETGTDREEPRATFSIQRGF